jgi:immune inhibitor A
MSQRLSLLIIVLFLISCSQPFAAQPTPTIAPTEPVANATVIDEFLTPEPAVTLIPSNQPTAVPPTAPTEPTEPTNAPTQQAVDLVIDQPENIAQADAAPRDQTELVEMFKNQQDIPRVARTEPLNVAVGDIETFWVSNILTNTNYEVQAELRYVGQHVLMYVDTAVRVSQENIEQSAKAFDEHIYQQTREVFGEEIAPGIDGDLRLTVLNTPLEGAGGYFSSSDSVVKAVNRFSNEREMFVIGINSYPLGTEAYASTLAHEFQHMIQWNVAPRSPSWFNEGMSKLAEDINGYIEHGTAQMALRNPDIQLTTWSSDAAQTGEHYGTSHLFMRYMYDQYGGAEAIAELIARDAGNNLEVFAEIAARTRPDITSFAELYADWAVANVLKDGDVGDGRYNYELLPRNATAVTPNTGTYNETVSQFGSDYYGIIEGPASIEFDGNDTIGITGGLPNSGNYMWWSNRGDDSIATLTRSFDLSNLSSATLEFSTWYEIENDWDYAFVTVSTDNGATWEPLAGNSTTNADPQGQNLGNGITGVSGFPNVQPDEGTRARWIEEQMDLTPYVGQEIQIRFWMINDAAYNAQGMLIDDIRIPELNYSDDIESESDWEAVGFVRTTGVLKQEWELRIAYTQGQDIIVEKIETDEQGRASFSLPQGSRAILTIIGATPFTTEQASYTLNFR